MALAMTLLHLFMVDFKRKKMKEQIIFHADDFGANEEISRHILDCFYKGALTSLSVLPNSPKLAECMEMLRPMQEKLHVSIHFNLAEGPCVAKPEEVALLVNEKGMLDISFFQVLSISLFGTPAKKRMLHKQIKTELRAQLMRMLPYIKELRIDSHQHYHMIPLVLDCILEIVEELPKTEAGKNWLSGKKPEIVFLRIPAEPLTPFLGQPGLYLTYRPINLVKNLVLNTLAFLDRKKLKSLKKNSAVFFGILLSGKMDLERVERLLPAFEKISEKKNLPLEVLCHPGGVEHPDKLMDLENADCVAFYRSQGRKLEKQMLCGINRKRS